MRRLLKYLRDYKKECVLGPLFKLLEASFELIVPLVVAALVDTGIAGKDAGFILRMGALLLIFAAVGLVCSVTAQYFAARAAVGFAASVRAALFRHIESLSFTEMDAAGTSSMITRMTSDLNQVQNGINLTLRLFLRSPFVVLGAMGMAFSIDVKAALIFAVTIPALSAVIFGIMLVTIPLYKKAQSALDRVLGATRETLAGSRVIRAFNKEEDEIRDFESKTGVLQSLQLYVGKISAAMSPATYILINAATLVLIGVGAIHVDRGVITQGQVIALVSYMSQILTELVKLADLVIQITKAVACGNRIESLFELVSSQKNGSVTEGRGTKTSVVFENVSLTYQGGGAESLSNISFAVQRGQTVGIIGGTGSGKTSLVHLIGRFYDATKGRVLVDGVDVKDYDKTALRNKIGIVMQNAVLFQGTIRENLKWGKEDATEEELQQALVLSQAKEFVDRKELGLDDPVEQNGRNLSGGQRQRLAIARALVKSPEILILDDSASALDLATDAGLRQALETLTPKPTLFIVSQRTSSVRRADQILVLDDGVLVGSGNHESLLATCGVYQEIYESQYPKEGARSHG